jgi:hypothetical protein
MHDLLKEKNFKSNSKDELTQDLKVTLQKLEVDFEKLAQ